MDTTRKILILTVFVIIALPGFFSFFPWIPEKPLAGDFEIPDRPRLTRQAWFDGTFQASYESYLDHHMGLKNSLFRLVNQIDFSLFDKINAEGIVEGRNNYFFEYDYIKSYIGIDFAGMSEIDRFIRKFAFVRKKLKQEFGIDLIMVFEPGKASFMPENIPREYFDHKREETNYKVMKEKAAAYGIDFIDLNAFLISRKDSAQYPLYTRYGTHWSIYGMSLCMDTLSRYLEQRLTTDLPDFGTESLVLETRSRRPDYDIGNTMNLVFRLPEEDTMAYPVFSFEKPVTDTRPSTLVIGDSFMWNIINWGVADQLFEPWEFWYFYGKSYTRESMDFVSVQELDLKSEIEQRDLILFMVTERFLYKLGWGSIDDIYRLYGPVSQLDQIDRYKTAIRTYDKWYIPLVEKAMEKGIPTEQVIHNVALYEFSTKNPRKNLILRGMEHIKAEIMNNGEWKNNIMAKAAEQKIDFETMLELDAEYIFQQNHPEAYAVFSRIRSIKQSIREDPEMMQRMRDKAENYFLTVEEMLQIEAERIIGEPELQ